MKILRTKTFIAPHEGLTCRVKYKRPTLSDTLTIGELCREQLKDKDLDEDVTDADIDKDATKEIMKFCASMIKDVEAKNDEGEFEALDFEGGGLWVDMTAPVKVQTVDENYQLLMHGLVNVIMGSASDSEKKKSESPSSTAPTEASPAPQTQEISD